MVCFTWSAVFLAIYTLIAYSYNLIALVLLFLLFIYCCYCNKIINFIVFLLFLLIIFCSYIKLNKPPDNFYDKNITSDFNIISIPEYYDDHVEFLAEIYPQKYKVKLSIYHNNIKLHVYDIWNFTVNFKKPRGLHNYYQSEKEKYYFAEKIVAIGNVSNKFPIIKKSSDPSIKSYFYKYREKLYLKLINYNSPNMPIIEALIFGINNHISKDTWDIYKNTGTAHLIVISGLHISLVIAFSFMLNPMLSYLFAVFYGFIAGFGISAIRALLLSGIAILCKKLNKNTSLLDIFGLSIIFILIIYPSAVLYKGFWLSILCVFILIASSFFYKNIKQSNIDNLTNSYLLFLTLMPVSILFFNKISPISILANFVAIPFASFLIVPVVLIILVLLLPNINLNFLIKSLLSLASFNIDILEKILKYLSSLNSSYIDIYNPSFFAILLSILCSIFIVFIPSKIFNKKLLNILYIPLFLINKKNIAYQNLELTVIDVGQGLSIIGETKNHVFVYDTGLSFNNFSISEVTIKPYLNNNFYKKIDKLIISHLDNDHNGGTQNIIDNFEVKEIISSEYQRLKFKNKYLLCNPSLNWSWDGVDFKFLEYKNINKNLKSRNNKSCVLEISVGGKNSKKILLAGDIEKEREKFLVDKYDSLKADILLIPHHGSKTSSTLDFIHAVNPKYAILSRGYRNRYHLPHESIIYRYSHLGVNILDTAKLGAIKFNVSKDKIIYDYYLHNQNKYWLCDSL